jgi:amino acid adenylation domain-containing protein
MSAPRVDAVSPDFSLSYTQESLWLLDKMSQQQAPAYNECLAFRIEGHLRVDDLRGAVHHVVQRHETLRTCFHETPDGLRAGVREASQDVAEVVDLRHLTGPAALVQAQDLIDECYYRPFDLSVGPLLRAVIVQLPGEESLFSLTAHHIVVDGWSLAVILDEIHQHYVSLGRLGRPAELPGLAVQYSDYAQDLRRAYEQGEFSEKIEYWKRSLADGPELLKLPIDRPRPPVQTFNGSTTSVTLPGEVVRELTELCRREVGSTEFNVLLSAYAVLLHRYSGQDNVTIGTTVLNRNDVDHLDVVGCFVNTAALGVTFAEGSTFRQLLSDVGETSLEMLEHLDAPYPKVLESLDVTHEPSHSPVFQTMMTSLGKRKILDLGEGMACRPHPVNRIATKFDLLLYVYEHGDDFEFEVEFNTDLFDRDTIERMLSHYVHLLDHLRSNIDVEVSAASILPERERSVLLDEWNDTRTDYPDSTVIDAIEAQAKATPDAVAVEFRNHSLTYGELDGLSNRIANALLSREDSTTGFVGVYMERSVDMVVALLSIVKAGLAYVPIDPEYPADRIQYMIEDSGVPLVLTQAEKAPDLVQIAAEVVVLADLERTATDERDVARSLTPDSRVYMIYTSGSTGRPKGVVNRHVSLFNRLYWMQSQHQLRSDDRVLQKTPFSFDVSVWEFFWPLMSGARIVLAEPGGHRDTEYLKQVISGRRITTLHFVPSMLNVFLEEDDLAKYCASLRRVFCSGEALPHRTVESFYEALSCELHNLYGPTEAAIDVSYWQASTDYPGRVVPIGKPIANISLYVVDKHLQLQPIGVPGELCIGGIGLAEGYHNRPDLTAKAFVKDPFTSAADARMYRTGDLARYLADGQIEYLGRIDNQVKLRGFRIELGEIEAVVQSLASVREAAVLVHETSSTRMLVAYVVADAFRTQEAKELLRKQLPDFMVPQVFVEIPAIPTTANGKLDRKALPDPWPDTDVHADLSKEDSEVPATAGERVLVDVWREVLGVRQVGLNSNFFQLGGDSILSIRIAARLRELGHQVTVQEIFAHPTIRQLAEHLAGSDSAVAEVAPVLAPFGLLSPADHAALPATVEDAWPLGRLQSGMIYHSMLHPGSSVYHDIFSYTFQGLLSLEQLDQALRAVVANHPQLRSSFDLSLYDEPLQLVHSEVEVPLGVTDVSTLPKAQQDAALARWIEQEKKLEFDLESAPLLRFQVHVRSSELFTLTMAFHHVILDGWSVALVLEEIRRCYVALLAAESITLEPEEVPYSAYLALEQKALEDTAHASFWRDRVAKKAPTLLSNLRTATQAAAVPVSVERELSPELVSGLQALAGDLGLPAKSLFLGLHLHALGTITGRHDVLSGLVVNGRPEVRGGDRLVGLFLNTIPVPAELPSQDWPMLFRQVFAFEQDAIAHRRFPLAEILKHSGNGELFDVVFNYTDFHVYRGEREDAVEIVGASYFEQTNFGAVVHAHRDNFSGRMTLGVNYDAARIDSEMITRYLDAYETAAIASYGQLPAAGRGLPAGPHLSEVQTGLERQICAIVAQAIGLEQVRVDDNYLELGVDSITAIRIVARIKRLGVSLSLQDIFSHPTARELAAQTSGGPRPTADHSSLRPFELAGAPAENFPSSVVDAYPATALQLDMVRRHDEEIAQAVYHDVFSYQLELPLNEKLLRENLTALVAAHETLRTAFDLDARPEPLQLVFEAAEPHLDVVDLTDWSEADQQRLFNDWYEAEKGKGFDWSVPTLMRFIAHRHGPSSFTLTMSFHHSIIDGWSLSLLVRDLVQSYSHSLASGQVHAPQPPSVRYRDYVAIEAESRRAPEQRAFWQDELRGVPVQGLPRPPQNDGGARWSETKVFIDRAKQQALTALSHRLGVPVKHTMLSAHMAVVGLLSRQTDVLTGVFTGGRLEEEGGADVLGLFLNFLPFRQNLSAHSWRSLIQRTFTEDRRLLPYRRYPLSATLANLTAVRSEQPDAKLGNGPVLETAFNYTQFKSYGDIAGADGTGDDKVLKGIRWFEHTHFALLTNVGYDIHQEQLVITLNADGRILPQWWIEFLGELYEAVLTQLITDDEALVSDGSERISKLQANLVDGQ